MRTRWAFNFTIRCEIGMGNPHSPTPALSLSSPPSHDDTMSVVRAARVRLLYGAVKARGVTTCGAVNRGVAAVCLDSAGLQARLSWLLCSAIDIVAGGGFG